MKKIIFFVLFVFFQILILNSYDWEINFNILGKFIFLVVYEIIIIAALIFLYFKFAIILNITIIILLFLNLLWSPVNFGNLITLEKNISYNVQIVGDVMPGFYGTKKISTDEKGFRTTKKINYNDNKNFRIFTIGGSTTEEIYLDDKETWSSLIEYKINNNYSNINSEVINTGVSGLRAVNHIKTQEYVSKLNPNLMIFMLGVNDWNNHIKFGEGQEFRIGLFPNIGNTLLVKVSKLFFNIYKKKFSKNNELINKTVLQNGEYYSLQNNSLTRFDKRKLSIKSVSKNYQSAIEIITNNCKDKKYKCMFVNQPNAYSKKISNKLKKLLWMTPPDEKYTLDLESLNKIAKVYNNWIIDFGMKNEIAVCDLTHATEPNTNFFYDDVHFNENGSKVIAEEIFQCIKKNNLILNFD